MREKHLKKLGFKKIKVSAEESGDTPFYYYVFPYGKNGMNLLTPSNDEVKDKRGWKVELMESGVFVKRAKHLNQIFKIFKLKKQKK